MNRNTHAQLLGKLHRPIAERARTAVSAALFISYLHIYIFIGLQYAGINTSRIAILAAYDFYHFQLKYFHSDYYFIHLLILFLFMQK